VKLGRGARRRVAAATPIWKYEILWDFRVKVRLRRPKMRRHVSDFFKN
jgi:hypothetical protein